MTLYLFNPCKSTICTKSYEILSNRIKQLVRVFSSIEKGLDGKEINIILSGKAVIKNLNSTFRKQDKATDILSFPLDSQIFGELWVCPQVVLENSKKFGEPFEKELLRITVHGLLHLSGHDHEDYFKKGEKDPEKIYQLQEKVLEMLY